jgi:hypothetical protein
MTIAQPFSPDIPVLTIDPFDEEVLRNPEPYYARLREAGPLVNVEKYGILACGRFKETQEIFADSARFVSARGVGLSDFKVEPRQGAQASVRQRAIDRGLDRAALRSPSDHRGRICGSDLRRSGRRRADRAGGRTSGPVASFRRRRHDCRGARSGDVLLCGQSGSIRAPARQPAACAVSLRGSPALHVPRALVLPDRQPGD